MEAAILVISNPVSGDGKGRQVVREHILPLLKGRQYELRETSGVESAAGLAADFLLKQHATATVVLVISGGDGTIHEVVNGIGLASPPLQLVIFPQGTANALYSTLFPLSHNQPPTMEYRLRSLQAFFEGRTRQLTLTRIRLLTEDDHLTKMVLGIVVVSTALHASILDTAEHLRSSIHGIERFKVAAARNMSNWYQSHVRLLSKPQIYDPIAECFRSLQPTELDLSGPFAYFLATVNVDRLESAFEISPLFVKVPPGNGEMDLIVIRPLRDPSLDSDSQETRTAFVQKFSAVLQGAYNQGSHITLRYTNGTVNSAGAGPFAVEYIRCGGWEWSPNGYDTGAHMVCVDGTVLTTPKNGKATCEVLTDTQYSVCA